jgi:hypothetical protein
MIVELSADRFVAGADGGVGFPQRSRPVSALTMAAAFFYQAIGVVDGLRHAVTADREVPERALSLRAPVTFRRNLNFAHAVELQRWPLASSLIGMSLIFA